MASVSYTHLDVYKRQERDAAGRWIPLGGREFQSPIHGATLVLTLERVFQYEAEKILKEAIEEFHADSGTILVLDPETGSMLALASFPGFDPNEYSKVEKPELFLNPALSFSCLLYTSERVELFEWKIPQDI